MDYRRPDLRCRILFKTLRLWQSYLRRKTLLTANEREFYHQLTRALPAHPIFP